MRFPLLAVLAFPVALLVACEPTNELSEEPVRGGVHGQRSRPRPPRNNPPPPPSDIDEQPDRPAHAPTEAPTPPPPPAEVKVGELPYAKPVPGKKGFVTSPYDPYKGYIDVRDLPPGTEARDPYSGKTFLVP